MARSTILASMAVAFSTLVGCDHGFDSRSMLNQVNAGIIGKTDERPTCEIQASEYALSTKAVAFELESDTGLSMGWDLISGFLRAIEFSFRLKTARLSLAMSLYDPLAPNRELLGVLGKSRLWGLNFKFDLGFNQIGAGFSHYSQTPLAKLSEKALSDGLDNLTETMSDLQDPWSTMVVAIPNSSQVVIPVGTFAGLKVGDQFAIFNVEHVWQGEPCQSVHLFTRKTTDQAVALGEVIQVENRAALLGVTMSGPGKTDIENGAQVEIHRLKDTKRVLKRSLRIDKVIGAKLQFENSQVIDIGPYLADQIRAVAHEYGFSPEL